MIAKIKALIDSEFVVVIFAVWTGVYLWQVINGEENSTSLAWIVAGFLLGVALF